MGSSFELFVRCGVWGVALNLIVGIVGGIVAWVIVGCLLRIGGFVG